MTDATKFKHKIGQWTIEVNGDELFMVNLGPDGEKRYFMVVMGEFAPMIIQEPDLAFDPPASPIVTYINQDRVVVDPDEKIVGVIQTGGNGRYSLTNAKSKNIGIVNNGDGSLTVNGEVRWIIGLYKPDGNRLKGYVAFTAPEGNNGRVKILEMGDLAQFPEIFK